MRLTARKPKAKLRASTAECLEGFRLISTQVEVEALGDWLEGRVTSCEYLQTKVTGALS